MIHQLSFDAIAEAAGLPPSQTQAIRYHSPLGTHAGRTGVLHAGETIPVDHLTDDLDFHVEAGTATRTVLLRTSFARRADAHPAWTPSPVGCMWEDSWLIRFGVDCSEMEPCPHCIDPQLVTSLRYDGLLIATQQHWVCPRVVEAGNEGGQSSTGVCLDCILDAARKIGRET
jgi:hypothetical protein